jgi:hypothetical protein
MSENMTALLHIRLSPSLLKAIQEMAGLLHISYTEYVRTRLAAIVQQERAHYEREFAPQVREIGGKLYHPVEEA